MNQYRTERFHFIAAFEPIVSTKNIMRSSLLNFGIRLLKIEYAPNRAT